MYRRITYYMSFVNETESRTLAQYLQLFQRCVLTDIVLVVLYIFITVLQARQIKASDGQDQTRQLLQLGVVISVVLLWFADAVLLFHFKKIVTSSVAGPESLSRIMSWKRICVTNSSLGLSVYGVRLALEFYQFYIEDLFDEMKYSVFSLAFVMFLKIIRIMAVNSFSKWLRIHWVPQGNVNLQQGQQTAGVPLQNNMC